MGLDGRDDRLEDLVDEKPAFFKGFSKKAKMFALVLIVGIIIGAFITHYYIEPVLTTEKEPQKDLCLQSKELLSKENECLYSLLDDAQETVKQCSAPKNN